MKRHTCCFSFLEEIYPRDLRVEAMLQDDRSGHSQTMRQGRVGLLQSGAIMGEHLSKVDG